MKTAIYATSLAILVASSSATALADDDQPSRIQVEAFAGVFVWKGFAKHPSPYLGAAMSLALTERVFTVLNYARYDGSLDANNLEIETDSNVALEFQRIATGLGYSVPISTNLSLPVGLRFGWGKMHAEDDEDAVDLYGRCFEPFIGLKWQMTRQLTIGGESQIVAFVPHESGSDDDSDSPEVGIPHAHTLSLSYNLP